MELSFTHICQSFCRADCISWKRISIQTSRIQTSRKWQPSDNLSWTNTRDDFMKSLKQQIKIFTIVSGKNLLMTTCIKWQNMSLHVVYMPAKQAFNVLRIFWCKNNDFSQNNKAFFLKIYECYQDQTYLA